MAVVLSHDTALRLLRTWDFISHAPAGILSPGFDAARLSDSSLPADSRPLDPGDFVVADRPAPDRMRALLDVPSPFAAPAPAPAPARAYRYHCACERYSSAYSPSASSSSAGVPSSTMRPSSNTSTRSTTAATPRRCEMNSDVRPPTRSAKLR